MAILSRKRALSLKHGKIGSKLLFAALDAK